jgi:hypothetical protein
MNSIEYGFDEDEYWVLVHTDNAVTYQIIRDKSIAEFRKDEDFVVRSDRCVTRARNEDFDDLPVD